MSERIARVGMIGTGLMGHGIAKNVVENGYPLSVMAHRKRDPIDDLVSRGAEEVATAPEMAARCEVVVLCVTGSSQVEEIILGRGGLLSALRPGTIIIDTSTSNPDSTLALVERLAAVGATMVDAPLSRSAKEAWEGSLSTMIGCDETVFARLEPLIQCWAERIVRVGLTGDGHKMKLINNFISMGTGALYAEALALASKVGIEPERVDSVIRGGRTDCGFYRTYMQYVLEGDREAHKFTLANALKDMGYVDAMADTAGMVNPLSNAVKNSYALAVRSGHSEDFVPMLSDVIAELNQTRLERKG